MKLTWNKFGIIIILAIILSAGAPGASDISTARLAELDYVRSADAVEITGVPFVWQELNGFCYWATLSMALQSIGIQFDLAHVLAATGIGFTAGYVRYEDTMMLVPGSMFRQQST
ncbi:MAG: hypothetical protein RTS72_01750, partial [Candidatus Thorarchaeota archaeon]